MWVLCDSSCNVKQPDNQTVTILFHTTLFLCELLCDEKVLYICTYLETKHNPVALSNEIHRWCYSVMKLLKWMGWPRYLLGWRLSTNAYELLKEFVETYGATEIVNSNQGRQFTTAEWEQLLRKSEI